MQKQNIRPFALAWLLSAMLGTALAQTAKRANLPAAPAEPRAVCVVAEFKGIGLHSHDPQERSAKASQWLQLNSKACSLAQAITIKSNSSTWLGTAETSMLMASIESMVESRQSAAALVKPTPANTALVQTGGQDAAASPQTPAPVAEAKTTGGTNPAPAAKPNANPTAPPSATPTAPAARPAV